MAVKNMRSILVGASSLGLLLTLLACGSAPVAVNAPTGAPPPAVAPALVTSSPTSTPLATSTSTPTFTSWPSPSPGNILPALHTEDPALVTSSRTSTSPAISTPTPIVTRSASRSSGNILPTLPAKEPPIISGSELLINVINQQTGSLLSDVTFVITIEYAPPLESNNLSYTMQAKGDSPYRIPITVPGSPSRAVITANKEGFLVSAGLVVESEFYHERINPFREGGVSEFLLEHTFTMEAEESIR